MSDKHPAFPAPDHPDFKLDAYPLYNLNRASWTYIDETTQLLKSADVDHPTWRVLLLLGDQNPSSVTELSKRSVTKMSTITRILIRMEESGLVTRAASPGDSRVTEVSLTDQGHTVLAQMRIIGTHMYQRAFSDFSTEEIGTLVTLLQRIRANLVRPSYLKHSE